MAELRKHPLTNDWIMIASHRQGRPQMPKDYCPFCPGARARCQEDYDSLQIRQRFSRPVPQPAGARRRGHRFLRDGPRYGKCEVILYSPQHTVTLPELPTSHIVKLVNLWVERYEALAADPQIKYVFIFENRGDVVGVTMPHPHGPDLRLPLPAQEAGAGGGKRPGVPAGEGRCLFCDMLDAEVADGGG